MYSSGCQDNFAIFAFLAFLLAVLDFVMETQMMAGGGKRKKREVTFPLDQNKLTKNATLTSYSMFRGFMNAMATEDEQCKSLFMCESGREVKQYGPLAERIAILSRYGNKILQLVFFFFI